MQPKLYKSMFLHRVCCISVSCMTATALGGWVGQKVPARARLGCRPETVTSGRQTCFELKNRLGAPPWCGGPSLVHTLVYILSTRGPCRSLLSPIEQGALSSRELLSQE